MNLLINITANIVSRLLFVLLGIVIAVTGAIAPISMFNELKSLGLTTKL